MFGITFKRKSTLSAIGQRVKNAVMNDRQESVIHDRRAVVLDWLYGQADVYRAKFRASNGSKHKNDWLALEYAIVQVQSMSRAEFTVFCESCDCIMDKLTPRQLKKFSCIDLLAQVL